MKVEQAIDIAAPKDKIWVAITDIENCSEMISAIQGLTILNKPDDGLVGLKWSETREMFGKQASETMWITEAVEDDYYCTRAESNGSVYRTRLALDDDVGNTRLTMSFTAQAESMVAKIIWACTGYMIKGSMRKALAQDLQDIKEFVEEGA